MVVDPRRRRLSNGAADTSSFGTPERAVAFFYQAARAQLHEYPSHWFPLSGARDWHGFGGAQTARPRAEAHTLDLTKEPYRPHSR